MKFAYSSNAYTRTSLPTALRSIAEIGFQGVEILCDHPHLFPGRVGTGEIDELAQLLKELGLHVSNLNVNTANCYFDPLPPENVFEPSLSSRHDEFRKWRIQYTIDAIAIASQLGASCVSVTSGQPGSGGTPAEGLALFIESLKRICETAEAQGINVGIEYEPGLLVERATEVADIIERVDSPRLGVNLDIGHSYLNGEPPEAPIELLASRIWNVHLEDIAGGKHYHLIPGTGDMPFQRYLDALLKVGYRNSLTVELYTYTHMPEQAGRESLDFLRRLTSARDSNV